MLIVCPTCASEYRIDTDRVGMDGRSVRCAACRETWFITPAEVLEALQSEFATPGEADAGSDAAWAEASAAVREATDAGVIDNVPAPPRKASSRKSAPRKAAGKPARRWLGPSPALAAGIAVLAALPLACLARVPVVTALPQTAGLYARIGLPVNLRGLEIRDVIAQRRPAEGERPGELAVEGDLVGVGRDASVPPIAAEMRDAAERVVATYVVAPPRSALGRGETARFSARFPDPPAAGRTLEVRFADAAPAQSGEAVKRDDATDAPHP